MKLKQIIAKPEIIKIVFVVSLGSFVINSLLNRATDHSVDSTLIQFQDFFDAEKTKQKTLEQRKLVSSNLSHLELNNQLLENIKKLLLEGKYKNSTTLLMESAAQAISQGDDKQLGKIMLLLGEVAILEQELDAAEVYLQEALDIAHQMDDDLAAAKVYQQLGHVHIRTRELARDAAIAYDNLWIARNQLSRGEYSDAMENLEQVIGSNLEIRRYGAAASAYETLAEFHQQFHDNYLAQSAALEAAKLYASSGQIERSEKILQSFKSVDTHQVGMMQQEINELFKQHQNDVKQTALAHDYQQLYHQYNANGDYQRAWKLRIQASKSLAKTSSRSMYQRQPDVLAILYNSNFSMNKAKNYLHLASNLFDTQGEESLSHNTSAMHSLIY